MDQNNIQLHNQKINTKKTPVCKKNNASKRIQNDNTTEMNIPTNLSRSTYLLCIFILLAMRISCDLFTPMRRQN